MKSAVVLLTAMLVGCSVYRPSNPIDISTVPNDCRNAMTIIRWLDDQAAIPQQKFESDEDYARHRNRIRSRIWDIRYTCHPV